MAANVLTRQQFAAKLTQAELQGQEPIIVREDGSPAHIWLLYSDYEALLRSKDAAEFRPGRTASPDPAANQTIFDLLNHPTFDSLPEDLEFPRLNLELKPAEFS